MSEMTRKDRNDKASKMKRFMDMSKKPNGDGCCVQGKTKGKMR